MTCTEYNGWTNKPTWLVHLWLTNESDLDAEVRDYAAHHFEQRHAPYCDLIPDHEPRNADDWMHQYVVAYIGNRGGLHTSGLAADLMNWTLAMVDWAEIAEAFRPEAVSA